MDSFIVFLIGISVIVFIFLTIGILMEYFKLNNNKEVKNNGS